jgi:hypothetical protein
MPRPSFARSARRTAVLALSLAAALALPACASRQAEGAGEPTERRDPEPTTLVVQNRNFSDMTIYVLRGGQRIRLGLANGNRSTRFTIPSNLIFGIATLQFLADPVGSSRTPVSQEIRVTEGDVITLTIPPG